MSEIYRLLKSGPMTALQIRRLTGMNHEAAYGALLGLLEAGVVEYRPGWRKAKWYLVDD